MSPALEGSVRHRFILLGRDRRVGTPHASGGECFGSRVRVARKRHSSARSRAPANLSGHGPSMTDFLTSLTARSFAAGTAILPRVASLFEPARIGDAGPGGAAPAGPGVASGGRGELGGAGGRAAKHPHA